MPENRAANGSRAANSSRAANGAARVAALALAITAPAACGRFGFDLLSASDPDGGGNAAGEVDGAMATGDVDAGGPDGGAGWDGEGGIAGCLVVTTERDEDDCDETPGPPHLGSGLSLREAIELANRATGEDCIRFAGPLSVAVEQSELPATSDPAGLSIDGRGDSGGSPGDAVAQLTGGGAAAAGAGLRLAAGPVDLRALMISGFDTGLAAEADGSALGPDLAVHNCGIGVFVTGTGNRLRGIHAHDNASHGVDIMAAAADADLFQVLSHDNGGDGVRARSTDGLVVRHATLALNAGAGIDASEGAQRLTVQNTILARNAGAGVAVDQQSSIEALGTCDFFDDTCDGCETGDGSISVNPRFTDLDGREFTLKAGSPCADRGIDTGFDTNGDEPGLFGGNAPDLGAFESN